MPSLSREGVHGGRSTRQRARAATVASDGAVRGSDACTPARTGRLISVSERRAPRALPLHVAGSHRLARILITVAALGLAVACWVGGDQPIIADAQGFLSLGQAIATTGPAGAASNDRTYVYPLIVSVVVKLVGPDQTTVHRGIWVLQVAAILLTAALTSRRLGAVLGSDAVATLHYALIALNPLLQMLATDLLSDVIAALLSYGAVVLAFGYEGQSRSARLRDVGLSALIAGLAFETRPSAALIVGAVALVWLARAIRRRDVPWPAPFVGAVALAMPIVPQVLLNWAYFGVLSPTIVMTGMYEPAVIWGVDLLRMAAVKADGRTTLLLSFNPFRPADVASVGELLAASPIGLAATFALHGIALVDHTLGFAYAPEIRPWYRWPLPLWSYGLAVLGIGGAVVGAAAWKAKRPYVAVALAGCLVGAGASAAPYLPMTIDPRYGLPLFLFFAPGAACAVLGWWQLLQERRLDRAGRWLAAFLVVLAACAGLSYWYEQQTPILASQPRAAAGPQMMAGAIATEPPRLWRARETQRFPVTLTNEGAMIWISRRQFHVYLTSEIVRANNPARVVARAERVYLPRNLQPGGSVTLTVAQPAPADAGCYVLRQQIVAENWAKLPQEHVTKIAVMKRDGESDGEAACP